MKRVWFALPLSWLIVSTTSCAARQKTEPSAQADVLKNWTLCRCLAKSKEANPSSDDAAKSAAAYLERGTAGMDVYEKLEALADTYLSRAYGGSVPSNYATMKCIDLYRSADLDLAVRDALKR